MIENAIQNKWYLWLIVMGFIAVSLGCESAKMERSKNLEVVEQTDTVYGTGEGNGYKWAAFTVEAPVNGPQALVDSVMAFLNNELYEACESNAHFEEDTVVFRREQLFSDDGERLLSHYMEKYKPLIQDSLWRVFGLSLKLDAQTEKYVTYGLEFFCCDASRSSEKEFYTFDKKDGHRIKEIISHDNLVRFFEDYPEYNSIGADPWTGEPGWKYYPNEDFRDSRYGLMDDRFVLSIYGDGRNYLLADFPYNHIYSYLSPEAQSLVKQVGEEEGCFEHGKK